MSWPSPQDYNEAVQNPALSFADQELSRGKAESDRFGLPRATSGAFASVYRLGCQSLDFAVRCFLQRVCDQASRYVELRKHLTIAALPYTVDFEFLERGIRVGADWYPMLKMEWVEGLTLNKFLEENRHNSSALANIADKFQQMVADLSAAGIAHGDLQHGNIMIVGGELRLVDYDGMFVESLSGLTSNELGHRNYQHPGRLREHFGGDLDNFSAWVIHTSLVSLAQDPLLWRDLSGGDECLLFRQSDFASPLTSRAFALLEHHECADIRLAAANLRYLCGLPPTDIPALGEHLARSSELTTMPHVSELQASDGRSDWLNHFENDLTCLDAGRQVSAEGYMTFSVRPDIKSSAEVLHLRQQLEKSKSRRPYKSHPSSSSKLLAPGKKKGSPPKKLSPIQTDTAGAHTASLRSAPSCCLPTESACQSQPEKTPRQLLQYKAPGAANGKPGFAAAARLGPYGIPGFARPEAPTFIDVLVAISTRGLVVLFLLMPLISLWQAGWSAPSQWSALPRPLLSPLPDQGAPESAESSPVDVFTSYAGLDEEALPGDEAQSSESLLTSALALHTHQDYAQAILILEQLLKTLKRDSCPNPDQFLSCLTTLGHCYEQTGRFEDAERVMNEALLVEQKDYSRLSCTEDIYSVGRVLFKQGKYSAARKYLKDAANSYQAHNTFNDPHANCLLYLSNCYGQLHEKELSEETFDRYQKVLKKLQNNGQAGSKNFCKQ